ncbi:MAG: hypothetical protein WDO19_24815 [Bacteroidota bacterium]
MAGIEQRKGLPPSQVKTATTFYSDGVTAWNRNHEIMANGEFPAGGSGSSTQSCIIVPKTADEKQYYIFTTDEEGRMNGFEYSIVDLSMNNGLGAMSARKTAQ